MSQARKENLKRIISGIAPGKSSETDVVGVLNEIGLDGEELVRELLSAELLLINAVAVIAENYLPLKYLWNWTQNRKGRTRKVIHDIYETNILEETSVITNRKIEETKLLDVFKKYSPRREKQVQNRIVCRGILCPLVVKLNEALIALDPEKDDYDQPFSFQENRSQIIAALLNWRFYYRGKIRATYSARDVSEIVSYLNNSKTQSL